MELTEKVSIIIPVYNVEKYLKTCLDSVLKQSYSNFELLLLDDGSTDGSPKICDDYKAADFRVHVYHLKNKGVSAARNYGVRQATGRYVAFIDSDDWVEENYLQVLCSQMRRGSLSVCGYMDGQDPRLPDKRTVALTKEEAEISVYSCFGIEGVLWNKLYDLALIQKNNIEFDEKIRICEDLLFVIQYISVSRSPFLWSKLELYHYNKTDSGAVRKRFLQKEPQIEPECSEYDAIQKSEQYILPMESVQSVCRLRRIKAAVASLRAMTACGYKDKTKYRELLHFVRKGCASYLKNRAGAGSSKISVAICSISPKLEYQLWKKMT